MFDDPAILIQFSSKGYTIDDWVPGIFKGLIVISGSNIITKISCIFAAGLGQSSIESTTVVLMPWAKEHMETINTTTNEKTSVEEETTSETTTKEETNIEEETTNQTTKKDDSNIEEKTTIEEETINETSTIETLMLKKKQLPLNQKEVKQ